METIADKLLVAFKNNVEGWTCAYCNSGSNQPAAAFREIKKMGYAFEEVAPNRWAKRVYCPVCGAFRSHYRLLSKEPQFEAKQRCVIPPAQRKRVWDIFDRRDAFSGASITSTPEIDHKVPWARLDQDVDIASLSDEQIKENFQLLTREHNLLKDRACQQCIKNKKRPPFFGISYWYEGGEEYMNSCVGCGWYDGKLWREKLNERVAK